MATLKQYFDTDFNTFFSSHRPFVVKMENFELEIIGRVHQDIFANAKFISCYVPTCPNPLGICLGIIKDYTEILSLGKGLSIHSRLPGERYMNLEDLKFTGRIFIYSEGDLADDEISVLVRESSKNGLYPQLRGPLFANERDKLEKPLAFISHDSRDKDGIARPLAIELIKRMCPVWYDEFSLAVGDSLREGIEKGIKKCKKCILIISPNFLSNKGWTKKEFDSVFTREILNKENVILPVWCGVTKREVYDYSPGLADRFAANWDIGVKEVAIKLRRVIDK